MTEHMKKKEALRNWIARKNGEISARDITDQTGIFSERLLKSVHVAELILFIEELKAGPVDIDDLSPGVFSSINSIMDRFFGEKVE